MSGEPATQLNLGVEDVEKVSTNWSEARSEKNDLTRRAVFNDRMLGRGRRTPEILRFSFDSTFSTSSLGIDMASSQVQKAQRRVYWSFAFLLALVALLVFADDRSAKAVSAAFAAILGIPFLLLSLFDLGRALKSGEKGGSGTRTAIWLLSHLQAAFGAICMAAAAFTVYHNAEAWLVAPARDRVLLTVFIFGGFLMVLVGFMFIHSAFVSPRKSDAA